MSDYFKTTPTSDGQFGEFGGSYIPPHLQEEMDKIRAARTGRMMMRRLSSMGQAYYLAMAELDGDLAGYLNMLTAYDGLTLADLQAAAKKYLAGLVMVEVVVD